MPKVLDKKAAKAWDRYKELGKHEAAAKKERKAIKDDLMKQIGKSKTVLLPDGRLLKRVKIDVAARHQDAYSFQKLQEEEAAPKRQKPAA